MLQGFAIGMSKLEVGVKVFGAIPMTMTNWEEQHPEFLEATKLGLKLSEAWWQQQGRENIHNTSFNTGLWFINMKNRFRWRDRVEVAGDPDQPLLIQSVERVGFEQLTDAFARRLESRQTIDVTPNRINGQSST
jgi:hypothetical protein